MNGETGHSERGPLVQAMNRCHGRLRRLHVRGGAAGGGLRRHRRRLRPAQIAQIESYGQRPVPASRTGRHRLLGGDGEVPPRLSGAHRRLRIRECDRGGPLSRTPTASLAPPIRSPPSAGAYAARPARPTAAAATVDAPVSIRALKRFVTEQFGPETGDYRDSPRSLRPAHAAAQSRRTTSGSPSSAPASPVSPRPMTWPRSATRSPSSKRIPNPGGMLTVGVPVFRLPRELVRREIAAILSLGVELKCNMRLGRDFTIQSLRAGGLQGHLPRHRTAQGPASAAAGRRSRRRLRRHGLPARFQRRKELCRWAAAWW